MPHLDVRHIPGHRVRRPIRTSLGSPFQVVDVGRVVKHSRREEYDTLLKSSGQPSALGLDIRASRMVRVEPLSVWDTVVHGL